MQSNSVWFREYSKFLKSAQWQAVRQKVFKYYGKQCYCCKFGGTIQVHHLSYDNYKNPALTDVVPLCVYCHKQLKIDAKKCRFKGRPLLVWHMNHCKRRETHKKAPRRR